MRFEQIPPWETEYRFDEVRLWRFDFAWPRHMVAVEVEGGTRVFGRHNRADGFAKDCEKYNAATFAGWQVFRFTADMVNDGSAVKLIREVVG
ncbi:MAG: hypothetical protein KGL39_04265 [Patescibacteria group bacterium]|nr:hypothetical protein [Patescibacteria group bacterium]